MYNQQIKSPYWEIEKIKGDSVLFSSRNTGCADFVLVPTSVIAEEVLKRGITVQLDEEGRFIPASPTKGKE